MQHWDIARLIAPTTVETFFSEYWEKKTLVIRRGDLRAYESLVTLDDIEKVITTFHLSHPDVMMANATRQINHVPNQHRLGSGGMTVLGADHHGHRVTLDPNDPVDVVVAKLQLHAAPLFGILAHRIAGSLHIGGLE